MSAIRAERDYVIHEDFMKVSYPCENYESWYEKVENHDSF